MDMIPSECAEADTLPLMWVKQRHKLPQTSHFFYRWYVYHSQSWVVYGIVLPTSNRVVRCKALWQKTLQEIYEFAAPEDDDLPEVPYCGGSTWEPVRFSGRGVYGTHGVEDFSALELSLRGGVRNYVTGRWQELLFCLILMCVCQPTLRVSTLHRECYYLFNYVYLQNSGCHPLWVKQQSEAPIPVPHENA